MIPPPTPDDSHSPDELRQVLAACDRYEDGFVAGSAPAIDDLVAEAPGRLRPRLRRELLALEAELRATPNDPSWPTTVAADRPAGSASTEPAPGPGPAKPAPGPDVPRLGRYADLGVIGGGGMGVVHCVQDHDLHRDLALKVMRPDAARSPSARHRFVEESQITSQLQHPGIPPVFERGFLPDGRIGIK